MFVVGGPAHRTTELLDFNNFQWNITEPYPDVTAVQSFNIISSNKSFYVFGVLNDTLATDEILRFKNDIWSKVGNLLSKRRKFSVILIVNKVHIVGVGNKQKNEVCLLSNIVKCELDLLNTTYKGFVQPVLFSVDSCDQTMPTYESVEIKELVILSNATFEKIDQFTPIQKTNFRSNNQHPSSRS